MAKIVGMPRLSPTMEEATLVRWAKHEGDDIALDELVAEIETDKATMEWRAFDAGVLLKILAPEGTTLEPDAPVAIIGQRGDDIQPLLDNVGQPKAPPAPEAKREPPRETKPREPANVESAQPKDPDPQAPAEGSREGSEQGLQPEEGAEARRATSAAATSAAKSTGSSPAPDDRVAASPSVRRLAREHSLDLSAIRGSGPRGRIIQRDVEPLVEAAKHPAEARVGEDPGTQAKPRDGRAEPKVVPLTATRRTVARRLTEAKQTIPHYYLSVDVDAGPLVAARRELNHALEGTDEKVSLNDLLIRACAHVLRHFPSLNVSFSGDSIRHHQVVDISVAVALEDGLVTPVVRDADTKGVRTIAREVRSLAKQAREKKLTPEQMNGGTFSISNLGMYGIDEFAAVINPPQAAILAVGVVRDVPVVRGEALVPGQRMKLTLSCDHRAIDGAVGAEWLGVLRAALENPIRLLL